MGKTVSAIRLISALAASAASLSPNIAFADDPFQSASIQNPKKLFERMNKQEETRQKEMAVKTSEFKALHLVDRANAEREKWVAAISTTCGHIRGGFRAILTDQNKLVVAVAGVTALAAGIYRTREGGRVIRSYVDRILGQPSLIRESSRGKYPWSGALSRTIGTLSSGAGKGSVPNNGFGEVILYGHPGTVKTVATRKTSRISGTDFALITRGDAAPLGAQAVTKIHELFDEADACLCGRNKTPMSAAQRSALNALLYPTGDHPRAFSSFSFQVVLVISAQL